MGKECGLDVSSRFFQGGVFACKSRLGLLIVYFCVTIVQEWAVFNYTLTKGKATESDTDLIFQPFPFLSQLMPTKIAASGVWLSPANK